MATTTTGQDVLLYIPNLIGYVRVFCTISSFSIMIAYAHQHWLIAIVLYISSFVGDLFDGLAARKFNQCSDFGSLLDMITDRCSTFGFLYILSWEFCTTTTTTTTTVADEASSIIPLSFIRMIFLGLMLLDISSHWCQMYSTFHDHSSTESQLHHKSKEANLKRNVLVRWYYQYYLFFGYLCVGAEFTYILLYIQKHLQQDIDLNASNGNNITTTTPTTMIVIVQTLLYVTIPGCVMKQIVNIMQLCSACYAVADNDAIQKNNNNNNNNNNANDKNK